MTELARQTESLRPVETYDWCASVLETGSVDPDADFTLQNIDVMRKLVTTDPNLQGTHLMDELIAFQEQMMLQKQTGLQELNDAILKFGPVILVTKFGERPLSGFGIDGSGSLVPMSNGEHIKKSDILSVKYPEGEKE